MINLLKLCSQSKRMLVTMAGNTAATLIQHVSFQQRILDRLAEAMMDKSAGLRESAVDLIRLLCERTCQMEQERSAMLKSSSAAETLERLLPKSLGDASGTVRERSRDIYHFFEMLWPDRCAVYVQSSAMVF